MGSTGETLSQRQTRRASPGTGAACLFLELECARPLAGPGQYWLQGMERFRCGRGPARSAAIDGRTLSLTIADGWMSSQHAELKSAGGCWEMADLDSKNGSLVNGARVQMAALGDGDLIQGNSGSYWLMKGTEFRRELNSTSDDFAGWKTKGKHFSFPSMSIYNIQEARAIEPFLNDPGMQYWLYLTKNTKGEEAWLNYDDPRPFWLGHKYEWERFKGQTVKEE